MENQQRQGGGRVLADGWGQQASGSVFCADSSLRFIYESHAPASVHPTAAAITSLAAPDQPLKMDSSAATSFNGFEYPMLSVKQVQQTQQLAAKTSAAGFETGGGVDLFEAEIARACMMITKQVPSLPHSFRECSFCLSPNAYAQIALCGHTFHSKCFLRWFRMNRCCPLCRGLVDRVQLAEVVSVQDELEAIMAEIDDEPLDVGTTKHIHVGDPLMENPELLSFLESDFDTDMDMVGLDDIVGHSHQHNTALRAHMTLFDEPVTEDVEMDMDMSEAPQPLKVEHQQPVRAPAPAPAAAAAPVPAPPQYAPASTMPNYWNVLNQGMYNPAVVIPPQQHHMPNQRMVHIAPKPDAHALRTPHQYQQQQQAIHQHHHHSQPQPPTVDMLRKAAMSFQPPRVAAPAAPRVVSCRCTGGCRNGRCACVKEGGMCGASCRCTSCKNPFLMVKTAGADIDALLKDDCFMHNVSKTRDMVVRLQEPVQVPCCQQQAIKVIDCVQGYKCPTCSRGYDFSWCMNKLVDSERTPRNHCSICKRCCDHRDVHCHDCGRCYFAGVATSLPCPCKESSHHKKRREAVSTDDAVSASAASPSSTASGEDEAEGECCIM